MSNGRTPRFGSYIDDILVSKALIKLTELIFWWGLGTKTALFPKRKEKSLFAQSSVILLLYIIGIYLIHIRYIGMLQPLYKPL